MKQQTAVSWLAEQLKKQGFLYDLDIEAAKQMEKEQIADAANQKIFGDITFTGSDEVITKGENYYNQTYNNENTNGTSTS
jgi:hypothetical protein